MSNGADTDCPVCGCRVRRDDPAQWLIECECCGTVWIQAQDTLERVLVGPED